MEDARKRPRMDVRSLSRWRALNERTAFPAASLHRSPLVGRVTSTTSLMLRTIALAGVHDGKSISFRVSLSGSWHETKFRGRRGREKEREGRRNSLSWRTNYSWAGGERCSCSIRGHTEQEEGEERGRMKVEGRRQRRILGGESIHLAASLGT